MNSIFDAVVLILTITYGIIIGSFLNVCIYRIPKNESIVVVRSHCMSCGKQIKWYDLVPLVSFLILKGNAGIVRQNCRGSIRQWKL